MIVWRHIRILWHRSRARSALRRLQYHLNEIRAREGRQPTHDSFHATRALDQEIGGPQ